MKKFMIITLMVLLFFLQSESKECHYSVYNYKENSIVIKFDCDTVLPFHVSIFTQSGECVDGFFYKPDIGEKVFSIIFSEPGAEVFTIEIDYLGKKSSFLFKKKN